MKTGRNHNQLKKKCLKKLHKYLKKGGCILINEPETSFFLKLIQIERTTDLKVLLPKKDSITILKIDSQKENLDLILNDCNKISTHKKFSD